MLYHCMSLYSIPSYIIYPKKIIILSVAFFFIIVVFPQRFSTLFNWIFPKLFTLEDFPINRKRLTKWFFFLFLSLNLNDFLFLPTCDLYWFNDKLRVKCNQTQHHIELYVFFHGKPLLYLLSYATSYRWCFVKQNNKG